MASVVARPENELPTLQTLALSFSANGVPGRYELAYSFAEYLASAYGPTTLRDLADRISNGQDWPSALEGMTGVGLEELTESWHKWLRAGAEPF